MDMLWTLLIAVFVPWVVQWAKRYFAWAATYPKVFAILISAAIVFFVLRTVTQSTVVLMLMSGLAAVGVYEVWIKPLVTRP